MAQTVEDALLAAGASATRAHNICQKLRTEPLALMEEDLGDTTSSVFQGLTHPLMNGHLSIADQILVVKAQSGKLNLVTTKPSHPPQLACLHGFAADRPSLLWGSPILLCKRQTRVPMLRRSEDR